MSDAPDPPERRLKDAERDLRDARRRYEHAVKEARKALSRAEKEAAGALKEAEKQASRSSGERGRALEGAREALAEAQAGGALDAYGGMVLRSSGVDTPQGRIPFGPAVAAQVDVSGGVYGSQRMTATRTGAGCAACGPVGCLAGLFFPKKSTHDERQCFLSVTGPGVSSVVGFPPQHEGRVREFAARVVASAQDAAGMAERHRREVSEAEGTLKRLEQEHEAMLSIEGERLSGVRADGEQRIHEARHLLRAAEANTHELAGITDEVTALGGTPPDLPGPPPPPPPPQLPPPPPPTA